jgi:hypothetical protein
MSQFESATQVAPADELRLARTPRVGELTNGWRAVTAITWILVIVALACVWKTSDQLGLSTWWLGPRGEPNSIIVQLLPFIAPVLMLLAAFNHVRYLPCLGLVASGLVTLVGVFDVVRFRGLGLLEIAIGAAAAIVSLVSLTGMYRRDASSKSVSDTGEAGV